MKLFKIITSIIIPITIISFSPYYIDAIYLVSLFLLHFMLYDSIKYEVDKPRMERISQALPMRPNMWLFCIGLLYPIFLLEYNFYKIYFSNIGTSSYIIASKKDKFDNNIPMIVYKLQESITIDIIK